MQRSIMTESSRISLREFIESDCFSKAAVHFAGECENGSSAGQLTGDKLHLLNASKLSLLLARKLLQLECETQIDLRSFQLLECFRVNVELDQRECRHHGDHSIVASATTVLGLDFHPELTADVSPQTSTEISSLRILGNCIYSIFSLSGNERNSPVTELTVSNPGRGGGTSTECRSAKHRMTNMSSLFSTLLETDLYPVSVCRLISDMIDGEADNPFTSVGDAIQDLEQMSNHPQIFLYNQGNDFYSSNVLFGQRCYGRTRELTQILEVSTRLEQCTTANPGNGSSKVRSNAVFVSGAAGSGKTHLVQNVGSFLTNLGGWMVLRAKFERDMAHRSKEIISSMFDELVANLSAMKESGIEADVEYSSGVATAISETLEPTYLRRLANFIPSIQKLIPSVKSDALLASDTSLRAEGGTVSEWQLVFLLSKLVMSVSRSDRRVMICMDDLQWCDANMLNLLKEVIVAIGQDERSRQRLLFIGMYRDNEVTEGHPLTDQLTSLKKSGNVDVTEIKLSGLTNDDMADMIMSEVRLPRRLVRGLAEAVQKKTSGHAIFAVQLLNSLVRDSVIAYSPRKRRFDWDDSKISSLKTCDTIASLIVSNLSTLPKDALQSLRILSCFGVQVPKTLLPVFAESPCVPQQGIESFLPGFIQGGAVEVSSQSIFFSHDLIQQHVYENIPLEERRRLHLEIGTSIASKIWLDSAIADPSIEGGVEKLKLGGSQSPPAPPLPYPLVAVATNQINFAGPKSVSDDRMQQIRFGQWNRCAGQDAAERSNFQAAAFYFKNAIAFLEASLWHQDSFQLCRDVHYGAAKALFAMGSFNQAEQLARTVIDHVPFEESIPAHYIFIRSIDSLGRYEEGVSKSIELLRKLDFDIPSDATPSSVAAVMADVSKTTSAFSFQQITNTSQIVDQRKKDIFNLVGAMIVSAFRSRSPFLPLIACASVNYSLQNGICLESANAFLMFGYFKVANDEKYEEGRYWGSVVYRILEKAGEESTLPQLVSIRADCMSTMYLNVFYYPFRQLAFRLLTVYQRAIALGDVESGEKLSAIASSAKDLVRSMMKHSKEGAKLAFTRFGLIADLQGDDSNQVFPDFGVSIVDERALIADAQSKNNIMLLETLYTRRMFAAFWMGDYDEANKWCQSTLELPSSKMISLQLIFVHYFRGLMAFQRFRDGEGEDWLDEGNKVVKKMEVWVHCSTVNFQNKLLLLAAEQHAAQCNIQAAKAAYEASVHFARSNGLFHEQGLACELYGKFLASIIEVAEGAFWMKCAHACYIQWGALAKARKLWNDHNLGLPAEASMMMSSAKRGREP